SSPAGYPAEPLVSYQINRQLSGWNLPPLVIRAFGAHCQEQTSLGSAALPRFEELIHVAKNQPFYVREFAKALRQHQELLPLRSIW
ncbi:MAG: hypothetical protein WBF73_09785, partial [Bradyrhizobium sp.]